MTSKILTALFLLLLSGFTLLTAQQSLQGYKNEKRRILREQPGKRDPIFDSLDVTINQSYNKSFSKDRVINLNANIPDFQVNENAGSNSEFPYSPSISSAGSGNFVVTWEDYRYNDHDIYGQRYSSAGGVLGTNFKVNDDQGSARQMFPSISSAGNGNFVMTWRDYRNGDYDIYGQRYSSDGSVLGPNFKVNDDQIIALDGSPSISTEGSGNFVVTWEDLRNGDVDIYGQR